MAFHKNSALLVLDFLEPGGATRLNQDLTTDMPEINSILLAGIKNEKDVITQDIERNFRVIKSYTYSVSLNRIVSLYYTIFVKTFLIAISIKQKFYVNRVFLNLPVSSLAIICNPLYWFTYKIYIFHGVWHFEHKSLDSDDPYISQVKAKIKYQTMYTIQKLAILASNKVVVFSNYSRNLVKQQFGISDNKIIQKAPYIPPFIRNTINQTVYQTTKSTEKIVRFLVPSRWETRKGIHLLLEAIILLRKKTHKKFTVTLNGPLGPLPAYNIKIFEILKKEKLFDHVLLENQSPRGKILIETYATADAVILPSIEYETLGLVTLESLSLGIPVFCFSIGANTEILNKVYPKLLVKELNAHSLAEKLKWYLDSTNLSRTTISTKIRERVKREFSTKLFVR